MTEASFSRFSASNRLALRRRGLLGGALGLVLVAGRTAATAAEPVTGVPASGKLDFQVFRKGGQIGTHQLMFGRDGGALTVQIAADFRVGFGPLTLFRYSLRTTEHWQDGRLVSAVSQGNDNGNATSMTARLQGDALAVQGSKSGNYLAPPGAILGTHWNRAELDGPMIDPENGELMRFSVAPKGTVKVEVGDKPVAAACYALTGPATIELCYDSQSVWSGLQAVAKDGSIIDYRLS